MKLENKKCYQFQQQSVEAIARFQYTALFTNYVNKCSYLYIKLLTFNFALLHSDMYLF